jgi:glycosyltransferase involved in cell wall biosynthesis
MMRLCYIANLSIHTQRWARYFVEHGHHVHVISFRAARTGTVPMPTGVPVHDLTSGINVRKLSYPVWARTVRRLVREIQPDVLHAHQVAGAGWLGVLSGYRPLVVTAWGSDLLVNARHSWIQRELARWVLRKADYVTCVSQSLATAALALGANPQRLEVTPWGVDTGIYHPALDGEGLRTKLGLEPGPIVLSPRSLKALYNPLDIAHAIPMVLKKIPSAQFIIRTHVRDEDLLIQFRSIIQQSGAGEAVRYIGDLPDEHAIANLYRVSDVIVSVPSSDGAPSSVLEALACGAVPVLSDVPSLHEWVQHGQEGLFVPIGDVPALSQAIIGLLSDEELRSKMQANGAHLIAQRADSKVCMHRNEEIYRQLIGGHDSCRPSTD